MLDIQSMRKISAVRRGDTIQVLKAEAVSAVGAQAAS
jgi:hypothetical protein